MGHLLIKELPVADRPRERLLSHGAYYLSNTELLAIIIRTGTKTESAKSLAVKILREVNTIQDLKSITINKLKEIKGIGTIKAIQIIAALELGRRVYSNTLTNKLIKLNTTQSVYDYMKDLFMHKKQEHFYCLYVDAKKQLIEKRLLFMGTLNKSIVHPREIFKEAYLLSATSIICVHNHPSGDPNPSKEDVVFTDSLRQIGLLLGINILDHIIIGHNCFYSFFENKQL
ncbi:MAG: RadC family protein [Bacilli bacterium]|jgi:DNA repair protein RadC